MTENPYAAPLAEPADPADQRKWSVSSGHLMVRHGAILPLIDLLGGEQDGDLLPAVLRFSRRNGLRTVRCVVHYHVSRSAAKKQSRWANGLNLVWYAAFLYILYAICMTDGSSTRNAFPLVFSGTVVLWSVWMRLHLKPSLKATLGDWSHIQGVGQVALNQLAAFEASAFEQVAMKTVKVSRLNLFRFPSAMFFSRRMLNPSTLFATLLTLALRKRKPTFVMDVLAESEHTELPLDKLPARLKELAEPWTNPVEEGAIRWTLNAAKRHELPTGAVLFEILDLWSADLAHAMTIHLTTRRTGATVYENRIWSFITLLQDGIAVRTGTGFEIPHWPSTIESHHRRGAAPGKAWLLHLENIGVRPVRPARDPEEWRERSKVWSEATREIHIAAGFQNPEHEMEIPVPPARFPGLPEGASIPEST